MRRSKATSIAEPPAIHDPHYRFVGGKGGVGKTTCAAAMAIRFAEDGFETLVISTDPAPSLSDALRQPLGRRPRAVRGRSRLQAVEIDAPAAFDRWVRRRRATLEEIALRGTWLDRDDVSSLLRLSLPGIDEVAALLQIAEFAEEARYERIVIDTAPTGHLLRMLEMPAVLQGLAQVFDHLQGKHRMMVEALRGRWTPDAADALIEEVRSDAERIGTLLRDPARARLSWITLPEVMSVEETADGIQWLRAHGIAVDTVIVNRASTPPPEPCRWCRGRRQVERQAVDLLRRAAGSAAIITVPAVEREPRGIAALSAIGKHIARPRRPAVTRSSRLAQVTAQLPGVRSATAVASLVTPETRLVLFGGKGGVGKTTCAAAVALEVAAAPPARRVLLLSADPAHSVGDALGQRLSDVPHPIRGGPRNLDVRELDAERVFAAWRHRFVDAIDELFSRVAGAGAVEVSLASHDRQVMRDLIELAPPGIDELVAIVEVTDTMIDRDDAPAYGMIVIDTAPTGHALRLIEMPSLVHDWVKAVMGILLKYQPIVGIGELGAVLLRLSKGLGRLRDIMADAARTRFVAVTRAAALPRAETVRLIERLRSSRVSVPIVIVNAAGAGTCRRCEAESSAQRREIVSLREDMAASNVETRLLLAPAEVPPPHGGRRLKEWRKTWREDAHGAGSRRRGRK